MQVLLFRNGGAMASDTTRLSCLCIVIYLVFLFQTGCTHRRPFYREDISKSESVTIAEQNVRHRILLIGDAGEPGEIEPVLTTLQAWAGMAPEKTTVIFLGDNIYPDGLPPENTPQHQEAARRLTAQIEAVQASRARGIWIPGNHDWASGSAEGLAALKRQEAFINDHPSGSHHFLPEAGCPGPAHLDLDAIRIIFLDTHWWLHPAEQRGSTCAFGDEDAMIEQFKQLLQSAGGRPVMVVAHHPLVSYGRHGGYFTWRDHLFPLTLLVDWLYIPLPIIGSIYPLGRWNLYASNQDLNGSLNQHMVARLTQAMSVSPPLIYASGHEHNLQVLDGTAARYLLISGAGSAAKISDVSHGNETLFAHSHPGFMAIEVMVDGGILLRVAEPGEAGAVLTHWLHRGSR